MAQENEETTLGAESESSSALGRLSPRGLLAVVLESEEVPEGGAEEETFEPLDQKKIGRYIIEEPLGKGGFGEVFLAHDESLERPVALKVIYRGAFGESKEALLEEGRMLAKLKHPGIVTVHDAGEDKGRLFFVSELVDGRTLGHIIREDGPSSPDDAAKLIGEVARALAYAHSRSVIHRDIKPTNIIVTPKGRPVLIDFGIALAMNQSTGKRRRTILGTPGYMSPEQARGESHLVDGRTDIYSLGVILYEVLTGRRPFEGDTEDLIEQVGSTTLEARPPRQIDAKIPKAIERICLKALAKRTADRYPAAQDFADDLESYLESAEKRKSAAETQTTHAGFVVPKGLRSFESDDSYFFLQLLPGLRDQAGIPDGIRFWQRGIENSVDPFRVGVLYGPSGGGKSSFLKAGLVPLLAEEIEVIYMAADAEKTEAILFERLRDRFSSLEEASTLGECIRKIREQNLLPGSGKLLIVIDQFEQWLHANGQSADSDLVTALRQCDGRRIQVILSLRDDFWMAIGQLMEDIDVPLLQSQNAAAIDLFEKPHARRVLIEFGRAYGRFPEGESDLTADQEEFISAALSDMEEDGKITPLQLALFAETAKGVEWTRDSYESLGGATAIGVEFLNSVFVSRSANPAHRAVEKEARSLLEALLPPGGELIRGRPLTEEELMKRAGLEDHRSRFTSTMAILDGELRLVTPADVESGGDQPKGRQPSKRYQLTHDYLIPSLKDWLHRKKRETARGRAQLRLEELAAAFRKKQDRRQLPSFRDWLRIVLLTRKSGWSKSQKSIMFLATRRLAMRGVAVLAAIVGVFLIASAFSRRANLNQAFEQYVKAPPSESSNLLARLEPHRATLLDRASREMRELPQDSAEWLKLAIFALPEQQSVNEAVFDRAVGGSFDEYLFATHQLAKHGGLEPGKLWRGLSDPSLPSSQKIRLAGALALTIPEDPRWKGLSADMVPWLSNLSQAEAEGWVEVFKPVRGHLEESLRDVFGTWNDEERSEAEKERSVIAAIFLAGFFRDDHERLLEYLEAANPEQLQFVLREILHSANFPLSRLRNRIPSSTSGEIIGDPESRIAAKAILTLFRFGEDEDILWSSLADELPERNGLRSWLVHLAPASGIPVKHFVDRISIESSPAALSLFLLTLGEYDSKANRAANPQIEKNIVEIFTGHPSPEVHAAASWLLSRWGWGKSEISKLLKTSPGSDRDWFYSWNGHAMAKVGPVDLGGSKGHRFAISMLETTIDQYRRFDPTYQPATDLYMNDQSPVHGLSADMAMGYCDWISDKEGIPLHQRCYERINNRVGRKWKPVERHMERTGYRISSVEEFLFATRGEMPIARPHGENMELLTRYTWFLDNSNGVLQPVGLLKPVGRGIFDALGNATEWCFQVSYSSEPSRFVIVGGGFRTARWALKLDSIDDSLPQLKSMHSTFRLVRTIP